MTDWWDRKFTCREITMATGLTGRMLRTLGTLNVIRPLDLGRGRGRVRTYDYQAFCRASIIASLTENDISTETACSIAMFMPLESQFQQISLNEEVCPKGAKSPSQLDKLKDDIFIEEIDGTIYFLNCHSKDNKLRIRKPICFGHIIEFDDGDESSEMFISILKNWQAIDVCSDFSNSETTFFRVFIEFYGGKDKLITIEEAKHLRPTEATRKLIDRYIKYRQHYSFSKFINISLCLRRMKSLLLAEDKKRTASGSKK